MLTSNESFKKSTSKNSFSNIEKKPEISKEFTKENYAKSILKVSSDESEEEKQIIKIKSSETGNKNLKKSSSNSKTFNIRNLSICSNCEMDFNNNTRLPLLLKCGHFYCKSCISTLSKKNNKKIVCPEDGYSQNVFEDLKILKNLVISEDQTEEFINPIMFGEQDENNANQTTVSKLRLCELHTDQVLNQYCEDTQEMICVYCALKLVKTNPSYKIVEMNEKNSQIIKFIDSVVEKNEIFAKNLHRSINELKKKKLDEEKGIKEYFQLIEKMIEEKKLALFSSIQNKYLENCRKIENTLNSISQKMVEAENIKSDLENALSLFGKEYKKTVERFKKFMNDSSDTLNFKLEIYDVKFKPKRGKLVDVFDDMAELELKKNLITIESSNNLGLSQRMNFVQHQTFQTNPKNLLQRNIVNKKNSRSTSKIELRNDNERNQSFEVLDTFQLLEDNESLRTNVPQDRPRNLSRKKRNF